MNDIHTAIPERIGLLPSNKLYEKYPRVYKCLSVMHSFYLFALVYVIVHDGMKEVIDGKYPENVVPIEILKALKMGTYSLIVSVAMFCRNVLFADCYVDLKHNFKLIDAILKKRNMSLVNPWNLRRYIIFNLGMCSYFSYIYGVYALHYPGPYILARNWVHYTYMLETEFGWMVLDHAEKRYEILNQAIDELKTTKKDERNAEKSIIQIIAIHEKLLKILQSYDQIFGLSIALRNAMFVVEVMLVSWKLTTDPDKDIYLDVLDVVLDMIFWCVLIFKSQYVINVGKSTIIHCLGTTLNWLRNDYHSEKEKELLNLLNQRVYLKIPYFTAAKFYTADLATFFFNVNMLTNYVVVIIQFATEMADKQAN